MRSEVACGELSQIALGFMRHLKQMKQCSFEYHCVRKGRFDWVQRFVYNGTKSGMPIHELISGEF